MRILFASSEVYPYSKTGGLGDVLGALPAALSGLGHEVLVVTPWYREIGGDSPLWLGDVEIPFDLGTSSVGIGTLERGGVRLAFVGHEDFRRAKLYGYPDDVRRFCRFTRSIPQVAATLGFVPDLVHVHDWHTAYLPAILRRGSHVPPTMSGVKSVITIHNAQYQGVSAMYEALRWLRLPGDLDEPWPAGQEDANALEAGVWFADRITTVSPSYAEELMTEEFGYGLEDAFRRERHKLVGILNGIDTDEWDPAQDRWLPACYSARDLAGKRQAKCMLCERAGLDSSRPLLAVVSRLASQKGIDVLLEAAPALVRQGWSLFLLGSGDVAEEESIRTLAASNRHVGARLEYDEATAHLVYAAADALAIPSRFEPCGLSQLIAMRYGTIPLARATGGLKDTIAHGHTGFLFTPLTATSIASCAGEAYARFATPAWDEMVQAAMAQDFSWANSAERYQRLYREIGGET